MTSEMKRVNTLYRVSTTKQVDVIKDDIPMQRIACREFAERNGWVVTHEFEEKGISGSKVSAEKRDAIQDLKECALRQEFDILLVFMFDRLGRIDSETPFVLEWFTTHGIEVWSVNEGQQRMETHADRLMNFIRFWLAAGESEKTSIRVKTRLRQMTSEGIYTGGSIMYGYQLVYKGRKNKKGQDMRDLAIHPEEMEVVKRLFRLTIMEGYGTHQLAKMLNDEGLRTHNGAKFQSKGIYRILTNIIYTGYILSGGVCSERQEDLQSVSDEDFLRVQEIFKDRAIKDAEKRTIALTNRGKALLSGNVFCMHCGCRMATSRSIEVYEDAEGNTHDYGHIRYICYHRSRRLNDCDGATTYNADKIDAAVMVVIRNIFSRIGGCPQEEQIQSAYKKRMEENHLLQKRLDLSLKKDYQQLEVLRDEIGKALLGDSIYSSDDLQTAIQRLKDRISQSETKLAELQAEDAEKKAISDSIVPAYRQFKSWAEEFEEAPLNVKKMIVGQLFDRVEVGKGYQIRLVMNMTYRQFCENWNGDEWVIDAA